MSEDELKSSKRILDPIERSSEVLFGLIMVLTFTTAISTAEAGRAEVRTMLIGALGCNLAWGVIDALMYLMAALSQKGHGLAALNALRHATSSEAAHAVICQELPPIIARAVGPAQLEYLRQNLLRIEPIPARPELSADDWKGAFGVFLLVFLSTFPVVLPFLLTTNARRALRISNLIAILMLALAGYSYGYYSGQRKWVRALGMVLLSSGMVALAVALGG